MKPPSTTSYRFPAVPTAPHSVAALRFTRKRTRGTLAFSRLDLIALIAAVLLFGIWFALHAFGEKGRIARCTRNLKLLGDAMHSYSQDHGGGLPPAGVESPQSTWDAKLYSYLKPGIPSNSDSSEVMRMVAPRFLCPTDPISRGERPRSYAMSSHDMTPANWPPGPDNRTGVGLWWSKDRLSEELGGDAQKNGGPDTDALGLVKMSYLTEPRKTLLLAELIHRDNRLNSTLRIRVGSVEEQTGAFEGDFSQFHNGRFNYLMADGHVELLMLAPFPMGDSRPAGIWTMKAGD